MINFSNIKVVFSLLFWSVPFSAAMLSTIRKINKPIPGSHQYNPHPNLLKPKTETSPIFPNYQNLGLKGNFVEVPSSTIRKDTANATPNVEDIRAFLADNGFTHPIVSQILKGTKLDKGSESGKVTDSVPGKEESNDDDSTIANLFSDDGTNNVTFHRSVSTEDGSRSNVGVSSGQRSDISSSDGDMPSSPDVAPLVLPEIPNIDLNIVTATDALNQNENHPDLGATFVDSTVPLNDSKPVISDSFGSPAYSETRMTHALYLATACVLVLAAFVGGFIVLNKWRKSDDDDDDYDELDGHEDLNI